MTKNKQEEKPKRFRNIRRGKNGILTFREAFLWEKEIEEFVKENIKGYSLNVPCGKSQLGDERLDIDSNLSMREAFDMFSKRLPYPNNHFDTVISDPPWKMGHYLRPRLFFELVRVTKVGGRIIYNATWIPSSKYTKLIDAWIRQSVSFGNVSIISIHEKIDHCPEEFIENETSK